MTKTTEAQAIEVCPHGCGEDRCHFHGPACDGTQLRVPYGELCGYCFPPSEEEDHAKASAAGKAALADAIATLGAVEVAPGRYAFKFDGERYCVAPFDAFGPDMAQSVEMPAWWTPERRYAVKVRGERRAYKSALAAERANDNGTPIVTASLETGEEVSA